MRGVHVANFNACTLTGQTTRAKSRQTALVGQTRQGVVLVHELRQLRGTEKLADRRRHGAHVNQRGGSDGLRILRGHTLTHHTLHAGKAHTDLVLDQLAHGAETTVTKVVDIVHLNRNDRAGWGGHGGFTCVQAHQVLQGGGNIFLGQHHGAIMVAAKTQFAVDLVAANLGKVVALRPEEAAIQQGLCKVARRLLARALLAVNFQQGFVGVGYTVGFQRGHHDLRETETLHDLLVGPTQGLQQDGDGLTALAVNAHTNGVTLIHVEL